MFLQSRVKSCGSRGWVSSSPTSFFSCSVIQTQKVYNIIPHWLFRFGKDLIFISAILRELKCDEGAFNLEKQTNFNEVWMNLYVQALFRPVPMPSSMLSIWILILVSYFNSSGPSYHNLFLLEEIANTKKCIIETFEKRDTFPLILIPISLKDLNIASYYFYYHVCVRVVHLAPHAKRCTSWDNEKKACIIWEKSRI